MGIWHPTIDANEVFQSRSENWNDTNPQVSVVLEVPAADFGQFVRDLVRNRYVWPFSTPDTYYVYGLPSALATPYYLYASNVEVLPVDVRYAPASEGAQFIYDDTYPRRVRVTYTPRTEYLRSITISAGVGTATSYGYRTQQVWVNYARIVATEFLTMDYNDFMWPLKCNYAGVDCKIDPLKPEEAPGFPLRTIKYILTYKNIFLVEDLEDIIANYSGTVNNSSITAYNADGTTFTFTAGQVLFSVEDVQPSLTAVVPTMDWFGEAQLYNLRCSFHCRTGEGSWNKFWRSMSGVTSSVSGAEEDESGWYEMYHKPRTANVNLADAAPYKPYAETNYWYPLWVWT